MKHFEGEKLQIVQEFDLLNKDGTKKLDKQGNPVRKRLAPYLPDPDLRKAGGTDADSQKTASYQRRSGLREKPVWQKQSPMSFMEPNTRNIILIGTSNLLPAHALVLYSFDHINRLRNTQIEASRLAKQPPPDDADDLPEENLHQYLKPGPLGEALKKSTQQEPTILLIDEIDKADIDFPNDLLLELDELRYEIEEIPGEEIQASYPPLIFITSNDEKELPSAFLRRCLFHYIKFPSDDLLKQIVRQNYPYLAEAIITTAVARFVELRDKMDRDKIHSKHLDSTSELLDWMSVINHYYLGSVKEKTQIEKKIKPPGKSLNNSKSQTKFPKRE